MEIRNALIILTKISSVFPVTRKSGINLEKRVKTILNGLLYLGSICTGSVLSFFFPQVSKIKSDEREDLKVLATGVAAALAARKVCCNLVSALFFKFQIFIYLCF